MKIIITLIFVIRLALNFGQKGESYIEYHRKCRLAENFFLQNDTINCFSTYNEIFKNYSFLFPRDCFMAAQFAHKLNFDSLSVEYILKGIPYGINPEFFSNDTLGTYASNLRDLKNSFYWSKIVNQKDSLHDIYLKKIDLNLKSELMVLIRNDQNWRRKNNKWFNRNFRSDLEKKYKIFNKQCMLFLDSVFKEKGYPGNWLIGTGDSLIYQTNYASFNNANLGDFVSIILYHADSAYLQHGNFLFKEIDNGHIHPRVYAMIRDFNDRHLINKDKHEKMYYNIWWERQNLSVDKFEKHCYEIGCPTKQHLRNLGHKLGKGYDVFWSPFR
jgi:hypothetical protein